MNKSRIKYRPVWWGELGPQYEGEVQIEGKKYFIVKQTKKEIQKSVKNLIIHKNKNYSI